MSRARDLSKLGNPNVIKADTNSVGFGTQIAGNPANADSSLISAGIVTATAFYGDGSNLEGVASAGLGTAVDDTKDSIGQNIYFTNAELSINENTTVNAPDTSNIAYTQYQQVTVESGSELIIADGDSFIPDVLGIGTALQASTAGAGNGLFGTVFADNIENAAGRGGPNFPLGITVAGVSTLGGNVSIGGTLTYEDVTNVDSIGIVTARSGIKVTGGGLDITAGGANIVGVSTFGGNVTVDAGVNGMIDFGDINGNAYGRLYADSSGTFIGSKTNHQLFLRTNNAERLRIGTAGQIGLGGANYGTSGQVLTSQGASAAPQWASAAGVPTKIAEGTVANNTTTSECGTNIFSSTYHFYTIKYWINGSSSGPYLGLQIYSNGAWQTGTYYYQQEYGYGGNPYASNNSANNLRMMEAGHGGNRTGVRGEVSLYDTHNSTYNKLISGLAHYYNTSNIGADNFIGQFSGGLGGSDGNYPITGIRFMTSSNQFTGGKWIVYGYN